MNSCTSKTNDLRRRSDEAKPVFSIRSLMKWHFSPRTGSPFWVASRPSLPFDPLEDVRTPEQLEMFMNWRRRSNEPEGLSLIPAGLPQKERIVRAGYQGTGLPLLERWFDLLTRWRVSGYSKPRAFEGECTLIALAPEAQFAIAVSAERARRLGTRPYLIDPDVATSREVGSSFCEELERQSWSAMLDAPVRYVSTSPSHLASLLSDAHFSRLLSRSVRHVAIYVDLEDERLALESLHAVPEHVEVSFVVSVPEAVTEFRTGLIGRDDSTFRFHGFDPYITVTTEVQSGDLNSCLEPRSDLRVTHLSRWGFLPGVRVKTRRVAYSVGCASASFEM
ncbi:hypothetical protein BI49514_03133 [Brevibacterium iodinum ATCC 49514]|uniref:Uncharacterized protein n=1 Tax=Brevibacterium iodinum ATCC 49514 TaxID=1255616 RepID=A0A2H1KKR4_9MICO|nr:hypothetical protein BI49514_03133 [Brevibacterium iodinum ATCC 49514]SUW70210.1 Uncharacterised protein [Brevibacterium iodinum]